jgi:hypothetical protein
MLLNVWRRLAHKNETRVKESRAGMEIPLVTACSAAGKYLSKYFFLHVWAPSKVTDYAFNF